jgi:methyltransferase family protein
MIDLAYADYVWDRGAFRQKTLCCTVVKDYAAYYLAIDAQVRALSHRRFEILKAFVPRGRLLDYGEGTGRFREIAARTWPTFGYDLGRPMPAGPWDVVTFFDSLEHLVHPAEAIRDLQPRWIMVSVPWCHHPDRPDWFLAWKHRKPGEHLWHFSAAGLDQFMASVGYEPIMRSSFEDDIRRRDGDLPNILSGIFRRV